MDNNHPRKHTIRALELADGGLISWQELSEAALKYLSDDDVGDLLRINELPYNDDEEEGDN